MTKFRPFLVFGVFLLTLAVSDALFPAQLDDLFDASVPVAGKESGNREGGLRDALLAVLVKLTGRRDIAEDPAAANLLGRGRSFLQRYTYEERENPPDPEDIFAQPVKEVLLHAWFDAVALQRAVRVAGLPLWGRERPTTLVWLAFETDRNRVLFSSHTAGNLDLLTKDDVFENPVTIIQQSIEEATSRRGIPWQFPFLDDEEKAVIGFTDVRGGFSERILAASERYATYGILAGNIFYAGEDRWSARWVLYAEHSETQWQVLAESLTAAIDAGIDGTADIYGEKFAVDTAIAGHARFAMEIGGVATLDDYARVLDYLENLSMVQGVFVNRVLDGSLFVDITVLGDAVALEQAMAIGDTLATVDTIELVIDLDDPDSVQQDSVLKYRLQH